MIGRRWLAGAALLLFAAPAASAAAANNNSAVQPDAATSLDCALWATIIAGQTSDEKASNAFTWTLTWFLGRYEGLTGQRFDEVLTIGAIEEASTRFDELNAACPPLMRDIGERMSVWGKHVSPATDSANAD